MTARTVASAALLVSVAVFPSYAQDPPAEKPAPPPAAVERSAKSERAGPAVITRSSSARADRAAAEAARRPEPPPRAEATPSFDEGQGGRRRPSGGSAGRGGGRSGGRIDGGAVPRGGVRNPDAGGGRGTWGQAVPRHSAPRPPNRDWSGYNGRRFYGGPGGFGYYVYDPWSWYGYGWGWPAYGAYGAWGGAWGGGWGPGWGGYYGGYGAYGGPYGWSIGGVRLKVSPRDAEVYVDGYYAGIVNDFDGIWQQLRLDDGGHRIEVKKPGFETLVFDVRVQPGRTITYRGEMVETP